MLSTRLRGLSAAALGLCALGAAGLAVAQAPAAAPTWTDPKGGWSFAKPKGWEMEAKSGAPIGSQLWVTGTADEECWILHLTRADSASVTPARVREVYGNPIGVEKWSDTAKGYAIFAGTTPKVIDAAVETVAEWPIQVATLEAKGGETVHGALHARPGLEVHIYCLSYTAKPREALLKATARSVATPKDAELAAAAAAAAAAPAPAPAPVAPEPKKKY